MHAHEKAILVHLSNRVFGITCVGDANKKMQTMERGFSNRIEELMEKDRTINQSQAKENDIRIKEMDYYQKLVETIRLEFKVFYDKYLATHHKSFDSKQTSRK